MEQARALSRGRGGPVQYRRLDQRGLHCPWDALRRRGSWQDHDDFHPLRTGLGLQPRQRRRDSRGGPGLGGDSRRIQGRDREDRRREFSYTDYSFRTIVQSTYERALAMAVRHGGRVDGDRLVVRTQDAVPAELEVWDDYGSPVKRLPVTDATWSWKGSWSETHSNWGPRHAVRTSASKGSEASIEFEGTGAIISGFYLPTGGKADIYLDGELNRTVDGYPDEDRPKRREPYGMTSGLRTARTHSASSCEASLSLVPPAET